MISCSACFATTGRMPARLDAVAAHEHRQLGLEDPDRQVLVVLAQDVLALTRDDFACALTRIYDDLSDLEH